MEATQTLNLLVVDDHPAVLSGVKLLLDEQPGMHVTATAASAEEALAHAERHPVDVAIVDYGLGGRSGLWLSRMLARLEPAPKVVIYSAFSQGALAAACVVAEADALLGKEGAADELCDTVQAVACGQTRLPHVSPPLADAIGRRLDHRDQAIFGMLMARIPPAEVAATLGLDESALDHRMWEMLRTLEGIH